MLAFSSPSMFASVMMTSFRRKGKEYSSRTYTRVKNLSKWGSWGYKDKTQETFSSRVEETTFREERVGKGPVEGQQPSKTEDKAAPQEEVNVLMFGVIQFSESLNYVYETTEAKLVRISKALKTHEGTLQKLGEQTEQAAEVEKQIKEVVELLQDQMAKQQAQTNMTKDWLAGMEQEGAELETKVRRLEMHLNNSAPTSIKELQERAAEHSGVLRGLQYFTQFHKENIESQNEKLSKLQRMFEIPNPFNSTIGYLVILALGSSSDVQFKGLFDQPSLPLPLSLGVWGLQCSALFVQLEELQVILGELCELSERARLHGGSMTVHILLKVHWLDHL
ncbi:hypothetical protein INR49_015789, partial [Caranx melampygus]